MKILIKNIKELLQVREENIDKVSGAEMAVLPKIDHAFLVLEDETITDFGTMNNCPDGNYDEIINTTGKAVLPTWVEQPHPYCIRRKPCSGIRGSHQRIEL